MNYLNKKSVSSQEVRSIKVYELMTQLEKLPSGAEVMCSGAKTVDELEESEALGKNDYSIEQYSITENIVDVNLEGNHVYLQF